MNQSLPSYQKHHHHHLHRSLHHSRSSLSNLGSCISLSVERFVTVSECIVDDDTRAQMFNACTEARVAASKIEKLCYTEDTTSLLHTARNLLTAVTRVLLLTDSILVKQLIGDKVSSQLNLVSSFIEFVYAFSSFGIEMIEFCYLLECNEQKDLRFKEQMECARKILEKSTNVLFIAAKTHHTHPGTSTTREIRDTIFCQMRRGLDLIHYIIKESIISSDLIQRKDVESNINSYLFRLIQIDSCRPFDEESRVELPRLLDRIMERIQDFTDSAYTRHEHRENILLLCDRLKLQLNQLLRIGVSNQQLDLSNMDSTVASEFEATIEGIIKSVQELKKQLEDTTFLQAHDLRESAHEYENLVQILRNSALIMDNDRLEEIIDVYFEYIEHVQEVSRLLRHISPNEPLIIRAKYMEINLKIYGSLIPTASRVLSTYPNSKIAKDNLDCLIHLINWLIQDLNSLAKDVQNGCSRKEYYMSLPKRGKHGTTQKPLKAIAAGGGPVNPSTVGTLRESSASAGAAQVNNVPEDEDQTAAALEEEEMTENNDILRRAKLLSQMALNMYEFTRGAGECKTTQDLFTQAEYFAEEANRLYKVVRQFSYMVPTGLEKKSLLEKVDEVPTRVQQLQFTVKNSTVGKAATFTKVDSVINETKSLMEVITTVVGICFETASKYKLDFSTISPRRSGIYSRSDSEEMVALGNSMDGSKGLPGSTSDSV